MEDDMDIIPQKLCPRCKETKPTTEFAKSKGKRDGLQSHCKHCRRAYYQSLRNDPEWVDATRNHARDRYQSDPEYRANMRASSNRYDQNRWSNDAEYRKKKIAWKRDAIKNKPHWQAKERQWRRTANHARRARLNGAGGAFTPAEWDQLCEFYDHRCVCCGQQASLTADHVKPITKGGTSYISNIQPLCKPCNSKKHNRIIDYRPTLPPWMGSD